MARKDIEFGKATRPKKYKGKLELKAPGEVKILEMPEKFTPGKDKFGLPKRFELKYQLKNPQNNLKATIRIFEEQAQVPKNENPILVYPLAFEDRITGEHSSWPWTGILTHGEKASDPIPFRAEKPYWLKVSLFQLVQGKEVEVAHDKKEFKVGGPELIVAGFAGKSEEDNGGDPQGKAANLGSTKPSMVVGFVGKPGDLNGGEPQGKAVKLDSKKPTMDVGVRGKTHDVNGGEPEGKAVKLESKPPKMTPGVAAKAQPPLPDLRPKGVQIPDPGRIVTARWSKPQVRPKQEVRLEVTGDKNVTDDTEVEFKISVIKPDGSVEALQHDPLMGKFVAGEASIPWKAVYTQVEKKPERPDFREWDHPQYTFVAEAKGHEPATSEELLVVDELKGQLSFKNGLGPMPNQRFKCTLREGIEVLDQTDPDGKFHYPHVPEGKYKLKLVDDPIKACNWSRTKVRPGQKANLCVFVSQELKDGDTVKLTIWEQDEDGQHDPVPTGNLSGTVKDSKVEVPWEVVYMEDTDDVLSAQELAWKGEGFEQFSLPEYFFVAEAKGQKMESGLLTIADIIEGVLEYEDGEPISDQPFLLLFRGGKMKACTDSKGGYRVVDVPPGEYDLELADSDEEVHEKEKGNFSNLRWSKNKGRPDETVTLSFDVDENVPDGTVVKIKIWEEDKGGENDPVDTGELEATVSGGKGSAEWKVIYMADTDDELSAKEEAWKKAGFVEFSLPEYFFELKAENCEEARSGLLTISDIVEGVLEYDDGDPIDNTAIVLTFKGGVVKSRTDSKGGYRIEDVPPGAYKLDVLFDDDEPDPPVKTAGDGYKPGTAEGGGGADGAVGAVAGGAAGGGAAMAGTGQVQPGEAATKGKLTGAKWSEAKTRPGTKVKLTIDAVDFPDGTEVKIKLLEHDDDGQHDPVPGGELSAKIAGNKAETEWECIYMEDTDDTLTSQELNWQKEGFAEFSLPEYMFVATAEGSEIKSGLLRISDIAEGVLKYDDGDPIDNEPIMLVFKGGSIKARTDSKGGYRIEDVPPGAYTIEILDDDEPEPAVAPSGASGAAGVTAKAAPAAAPTKAEPQPEKPQGKFSGLAWSKPKARPEETVQLTFNADQNVPDGTKVTIKLFESDDDGQHDPVPGGDLSATVSGGKAQTEWKVTYMEDTDDTLTAQELAWQKEGFKEFSLPEYFFELTAENCEKAKSGLITIADIVEGVLKYSDGDPVADTKIRLIFGGGTREATTDSKGGYRIDDVPPGAYDLEIVDE